MKEFWNQFVLAIQWIASVMAIIFGLIMFFVTLHLLTQILSVILVLFGILLLPPVYIFLKLKFKILTITILYLGLIIGLILNETSYNSSEKEKYYVSANVLNVRKGSSEKSDVITKLKKGDEVQIVQNENGWLKIVFDNNKTGYVSEKYVSKKGNDKNDGFQGIILVTVIVLFGFFGKKGANVSKGISKKTSNVSYKEKPKAIDVSSNNNLKAERKYYYCKHCGSKHINISSLKSGYCPLYPLGNNKGKHVLYEGLEKKEYSCKHCGYSHNKISFLVSQYCPIHPLGNNKGRHEPEL